jgi:hypothetical protein
MRLLTFFAFFVALASCTNRDKIPDDILKPEKMETVLWDYIQADVYVTDHFGRDSTRDKNLENAKLQLRVFEKHRITKDQFYKSYRYYVDHPQLMRTTIDSILQEQRRTKPPRKPNKTINSI